MDYISQANVGGTTYTVGLPNVYINDKGNLNIETSATIGNTPATKGKINIEANSDIQLKPGDDITLYSHHRESEKQNEVAIKVLNGLNQTEYPVQLLVNASDIVLTTKDKTGTNANVMDVAINTGAKIDDKPVRGYLKVRAQAIDLRCENHGGIALQPKGKDSQNHENKIKFEHGGGDGLEFGTFNTEKTSIFTDEYRFNKDGVWKMATRVKEVSDKADANDATTAYKYQKQTDDFYDIVSGDDETATTKDIIKTANALNSHPKITTHITNKGNLEIASVHKWMIYPYQAVSSDAPNYQQEPLFDDFGIESATIDFTKPHTFDEIAAYLFADYSSTDAKAMKAILKEKLITGDTAKSYDLWVSSLEGGDSEGYYQIEEYLTGTPDINIESDANISIKSANKLKLGGTLDFGSNFNFGETDEGIEVQYKLTAKNATKDCGVLKVVGVNNHEENNLTVEGVTITPGQTEIIAQCSILDIVKLVNYMKTNNEGPWTQPAVNL